METSSVSIDSRAFNQSSSYRKCLYSIFARNGICSYERYQYSYHYFKIYWKLILTSCIVENSRSFFLLSVRFSVFFISGMFRWTLFAFAFEWKNHQQMSLFIWWEIPNQMQVSLFEKYESFPLKWTFDFKRICTLCEMSGKTWT